jgi:uncharacterized membrane protein YebE (DUF533 family)
MADHAEATKRVETLLADDLGSINTLLEKRGKEPIEPLDHDTWMAENSKLYSGDTGASAAVLLQNKKGHRFLYALVDSLWFGL